MRQAANPSEKSIYETPVFLPQRPNAAFSQMLCGTFLFREEWPLGMSLRALVIGLTPVLCYSQVSSGAFRKLPPPFATVRDPTQFNALRLGPGNAIAVMKTPPDFRLAAIAISPNGDRLAIAWESGRTELWDLRSRQRISEFKPQVKAQNLEFISSGDQLVVTGAGGKIAFLDLPSGRQRRVLSIPLGRWKYDIQVLAFPADAKWLAYADEESSKVLDLTDGAPKEIADLTNAGSLAVSQDGTKLWTVNRGGIEAFDTASWQRLGQWPLKSEPIKDQPVAIRAGSGPNGRPSVAVPSSAGLVIYREPDMQGEFVTNKPTSLVEFSRAVGTYVNLSSSLALIDPLGSKLCETAYSGSYRHAISEDGEWIALSQFDSVEVWRVRDILNVCAAPQDGH